jgi:hypothetical protein
VILGEDTDSTTVPLYLEGSKACSVKGCTGKENARKLYTSVVVSEGCQFSDTQITISR